MKTIILALIALCLSISASKADFTFAGSQQFNPSLTDAMALYQFIGSPRSLVTFEVPPDFPGLEYAVAHVGNILDIYNWVPPNFLPGALKEIPPGYSSVSYIATEIAYAPETGSTLALFLIALTTIVYFPRMSAIREGHRDNKPAC